jgi:hypothetical protein
LSSSQVDRFGGHRALLALGQRQQGGDQPLLLLPDEQQFRVAGAQRRRVGVRVGERDLDQRPLDGQRGTQFVGGVGDEAALGGIDGIEPGVETGQRGGQVGELLVAAEFAVCGQPIGGGALGRGGELPERSQRPPGQCPPDRRGHERHHDQPRDDSQQHGSGVARGARAGRAADRLGGPAGPRAETDDSQRDGAQHDRRGGIDQGEPGTQPRPFSRRHGSRPRVRS